MVQETDNHSLNKYGPGDTDWTHSPDMQHIEERLAVRDIEANLGNYTPHSTATFIATDTGAVYDGDGTNWNKATREVESVVTDTLNSADYYISTSDDPQAVLTDAGAGSTVAFLPGTHSVTLDAAEEGVNLTNDDVTVYLYPGATVQLANGETTSSSDGGLFIVADGVSGVTFRGDGTIDGNQANNTVVTNTANFGLIRAGQNVSGLRVDSIDIDNSPGCGVLVRGASAAESTDVRVLDCTLAGNAEGVLWRYADDVHITDVIIDGTTDQDGIEPVHSEDWEIRGCTIRDTAGSAIDMFDQTIDGIVADCLCENNTNSAIALAGDLNEDIEVVDCHVTGCGQKGIVASNAEDCSIHNCRIEGSANQGIDIPGGNVGVDVTDCTCRDNGTQGIRHNGTDSILKGDRCFNNGQSGAGMRGIRAGGDHQTIASCHCYDTQATATQQYGIQADGTEMLVHGNHAYGNSAGQVLDQTDAASIVTDNKET